MTEALCRQVPRLGSQRGSIKRHTQNRVVATESTISAGVDALIRKVEWGKQPDGPPEVLSRDPLGLRGEAGQTGVVERRKELRETAPGGGAGLWCVEVGRGHRRIEPTS